MILIFWPLGTIAATPRRAGMVFRGASDTILLYRIPTRCEVPQELYIVAYLRDRGYLKSMVSSGRGCSVSNPGASGHVQRRRQHPISIELLGPKPLLPRLLCSAAMPRPAVESAGEDPSKARLARDPTKGQHAGKVLIPVPQKQTPPPILLFTAQTSTSALLLSVATMALATKTQSQNIFTKLKQKPANKVRGTLLPYGDLVVAILTSQ